MRIGSFIRSNMGHFKLICHKERLIMAMKTAAATKPAAKSTPAKKPAAPQSAAPSAASIRRGRKPNPGGNWPFPTGNRPQ
jgi:hypothetical protein